MLQRQSWLIDVKSVAEYRIINIILAVQYVDDRLVTPITNHDHQPRNYRNDGATFNEK